jgi:hypothetical protein
MHITEFAPAGTRDMPSQSEEWYVEQLRLTFIGLTDWTSREIFSEIAGTPASQINAQPPMQFYQEAGSVFDAYLSVTQQAGRMDVVLSDQPTRNTADPALPGYKPLYWIGSLKDSVENFSAISNKTISLVSGATRVAYAITLIHKTDSLREAVA